MGQKVHPIGFRLGKTKAHQSRWFINSSSYSYLVVEDYFIRQQLLKQFTTIAISNIEIKRTINNYLQIVIYSSKPSLILAKYENNIENLNNFLKKQIQKYRKLSSGFIKGFKPLKNTRVRMSNQLTVIVQVLELFKPNANACFVADSIVEQLKKRITFRRAIKTALRRAQNAKTRGVKIQVSGRLNGAEIARCEWVRKGQIPLQTLRARLDYCSKSAKTTYGILGIKVWIFKA